MFPPVMHTCDEGSGGVPPRKAVVTTIRPCAQHSQHLDLSSSWDFQGL